MSPHRLPDGAAQEAVNASLLTGDLRAFRQFALTKALANGGGGEAQLYVQDTFTGTGDMATHDGEVGANWTLNAGGPLSAFDLNGAGAVACTANNVTSGWFIASGVLPDATSDFYVEIALAFDDLTAEMSGAQIFAWTTGSGFGAQANIVCNDGGDDYIGFDVTPASGTPFSDTVAQSFQAGVTYTVRIELTNDRKTITLKVDGVTLSSGTMVGAYPDPVTLGFIFNPGDAGSAAANNLRVFNFEVGALVGEGGGPVRTIYLLNDEWLSWTEVVDVARGFIDGDTTYRVYLTAPDLYDQPQFTNYALATTGSEPYPVETRPLGVPAPESAPTLTLGVDSSATTFSIDVLDEGSVLSTNWVISPPVNGGGVRSEVLQASGTGNPSPSYEFVWENNAGNAAWAHRNFGIENAAVVQFSCDFRFTSGDGSRKQMLAHVMNPETGAGLTAGYASDSDALSIILASGWTSRGGSTLASDAVGGLSFGVWYTLTVRVVVNSDGTQTVTAALYQGSGQIAEVTVTNSFSLGGYCGFVAEGAHADSSDEFRTFYDNTHVMASGSTGYVPANVATSYLYRYVNDLGEASGPSDESATVVRPNGVSVTVATPTVIPSGVSSEYGITTKQIFRAATGNTGTAFRFVAEIPLATADYVDVLTDEQLGEVLDSDDWTLPPADLEGILALPNGVMAGFSKNRLCLSAQNHAHAWPVGNRLRTDTDIVGLGAIDTTVVIGTKSFVYWAVGNDPAAYSMAKSEVPHACVSKRSFAYLTGIGVVFAGPDGLMASAGVGQIRNLTETVFTRDQWQALNPSSMVGVAHNDIYWLHWEAGSQRGCYAIDMKPTGFGVVQMAFHAAAAYVDPIEDKMYLVLDDNAEPDDPSLPVPADPPVVDGATIFEFEGDPSTRMTYRYRGKMWRLDHKAWMGFAQIDAEDFDNLLVRIYGDGVQIDEFVVTTAEEFTLTDADQYTDLEYQILGTSACQLVQTAEDVSELT